MKKFSIIFAFILVFFTCFTTSVFAADVTYSWADRMGGTGAERGYSVTVDSSGNVYTTGHFSGTADFDPGAGTANLTSAGSIDIFITKFDSSGAYVWAKQVGGTSDERGQSIVVDSSSNTYITGFFNGTVDFDPGAGTAELTSAGGSDMFILKLDSAGDFSFVKQVGGTSAELSYAIKLDSDGNIYTTGYFMGTTDFDPGAGTANLTSVGDGDIFVSKLDSSGIYVWAKGMGGVTDYDAGYSIDVDSSGNVYTTGYFVGTADFDPGAGTAELTSAGSKDVYISKLDSSGAYVWAGRVGSTGDDRVSIIDVYNNSSIYVTGYFNGTADFDPGAGTANLTSSSNDVFVLKLDTSGAYTWAKNFADYAFGMSIDSSENVYIAGYFNAGTVDFDPGAGTSNLTSAGSTDAFINILDSSGAYVVAKRFGGTSSDTLYGMYLYGSSIYLTGEFYATADFDPGAGTANLTSAGVSDIFVAKFTYTSAPTVTTGSSSSLTATTATLGGNITVTGGASPTTRGIYYGTTDSYGTTISETDTYSTGAYTLSVTGLTCNTTYHYQAFATNTAGTGTGSDATFTTSPCVTAPTVVTDAASSITATTVTLNGTISATGGASATTRGFNYGTTISYGSTASATGTYSTGAYTEAITGLTCNTTYHFRFFATNSAGTTNGSDATFTTSACVPTVVTDAASSVTTTTVTLNGTISATGGASATTRGFNYGTTISYGSTASATGTYSTGAYTEAITGLTCNTTYHFRFFATNSAGTTNGSDSTFTTSSCPTYGHPYIPPVNVPKPPTPPTATLHTFNRNIAPGQKHTDIKQLQMFLNSNGYTVANTGAGSAGYETTTFGPATKSALKKFQKANNITPVNGVLGPKTRSVINLKLK